MVKFVSRNFMLWWRLVKWFKKFRTILRFDWDSYRSVIWPYIQCLRKFRISSKIWTVCRLQDWEKGFLDALESICSFKPLTFKFFQLSGAQVFNQNHKALLYCTVICWTYIKLVLQWLNSLDFNEFKRMMKK